ncbi:MAG: flagellar hook-associated protein FlgL [Burkholderiaceae bacterium]|nr:flagellar hook-associated protein FlgL [Burkholderiaceae bacterium]
MSNASARLGTAYVYDNALRNISARQTSLSNLQENLSSGKRVVRASDDPVASAQAERALTRLERIKTDQRALEAQRNAVAQAESTLGEANGLMQEARELIVRAGDPTLTPADRRTVADQINGLREQLLAVSNRKDTNGVPLLSALGSAIDPFNGPLSASPDYQFKGLAGQTASTAVGIPLALDGDAAFMFQPKRDGAYNAVVNNVDPAGSGTVLPISNNRTLNTSGITATDPGLVSGNNYTLSFGPETPGATAGTIKRDITITEIDPVTGAPTATPSTTVTLPDYDPTKPFKLDVPGSGDPLGLKALVPGLSFSITATPTRQTDGTLNPSILDGDTITLQTTPSIFSVLDSAVRNIGGAANNNAAIQAVGQALANIDKGMERVLTVRGQAGELLNRADRITGDQEKRSIQLEADRSRAEDLDMIKGVSDFQNQQTGYQAALQSYAQIQKLSLFNFIG